MADNKKMSYATELSMKKILETYIKKEERMRLSWFRRNETRLLEIATGPNTRTVPEDQKEDLANFRRERFRNREKVTTKPYDEEDYRPKIDMGLATKAAMRPVDPHVKQLLYKGTEKEGRANYLRERYRLIPEKRFFFPEVTSWEHGWQMWDLSKQMSQSTHGRQQVIRDSFYRRRGVERDPDWYREPAKLSPTVCGSI